MCIIGDTGVVGTALYLAPELLNTKSILKYSPVSYYTCI